MDAAKPKPSRMREAHSTCTCRAPHARPVNNEVTNATGTGNPGLSVRCLRLRTRFHLTHKTTLWRADSADCSADSADLEKFKHIANTNYEMQYVLVLW